jgi:hypothetical protein
MKLQACQCSSQFYTSVQIKQDKIKFLRKRERKRERDLWLVSTKFEGSLCLPLNNKERAEKEREREALIVIERKYGAFNIEIKSITL